MFNIRSVFGICLVSLGLCNNTFALDNSDISGTWNFVLSEITTGTIQLNVTGSSFTGSVDTNDLDWGVENGVITNESEKMYIHFERGSGERQIYHGWVRADGSYIAGYYQYGSKEQPWYATKNTSSSNTAQTASVSSNLDIHIPSATFGSSNIWVDLEYKGASGFDHLWRLKDYGVNQ